MDTGFKLEKSDPTDLIDLPKHETIEPFLGPTGESELGARIISLEKAVELATKYNRRFLSQKEDLYLQALDLSLARFQYIGTLREKGQGPADTNPLSGREISGCI